MVRLFGQWLLTALLSVSHPFFVSMTDINYNDKQKSLEISVRIFTDDFENTLRKFHSAKIDILHPANQAEMNGFVNDYIVKHLQLQVNGKPVTLKFVGYEEQAESIWTYFEVKDITAVEKMAITDFLLHDYNENQINMLHVKANGKDQSTKLDYPDKVALFSF